MTSEQTAILAKQAEEMGNKAEAIILYTLAGAKAAGMEEEMAEVVTEIAKNQLAKIQNRK